MSILSRIPIPCTEITGRPVCLLAALVVLFSILRGLLAPPGSIDLSSAEGRYLLLSGEVLSKETTAEGYGLQLGYITFLEKNEGNTSPYKALLDKLRERWPRKGRIRVFLNGSPDKTLPYSQKPDQADIYRACRIGSRVTLSGKASIPEPATNPGQYDAQKASYARHTYLKLSDVTLKGTDQKHGNLFLNALAFLRLSLRKGAEQVFGSRNSALISAIVLGDRSGLDAETRQLFQDGGILHVLAVSSLHVTLLGLTLYKILRRLRQSFLVSALASGFLVVSYCLMTGSSYSAVRAGVMFLLWLGSQITGRTFDRLTALGAAAILILLRQPLALTDAGFLLSFGCILSLALLEPVFSDIWNPRHALSRRLSGALALQAGVLPCILWFYYQATPYGILVGLIVLPSMSLVMFFGTIGILAGLLIPLGSFFLTSARLAGGPCGYLLDLFRLLCRFAQRLPGDVIITGRPSVWKMVLYYACLLAFCLIIRLPDRKTFLKNRKKIRFFHAGLLLSLFLLMLIQRKPAFRFTCLDVGQGSCALVEQDGLTMLFDCGSSSVKDVWRRRVEPALKFYGISHIDLLFLSHADGDHISGAQELLSGMHGMLPGAACFRRMPPEGISSAQTGDLTLVQRFSAAQAGGIRIGRILLPQTDVTSDGPGMAEVIAAARRFNIPISTVSEGAEFQHGQLHLRVLSPSPGRMTGSDNEDCIVLSLSWKNIRILFTGDLEKEGEEKFTRAYQDAALFSPPRGHSETNSRTILLAGHHGSRNATSEGFLSLVRPDLVLISCGRNNRYGHPAAAMLKRLEDRGLPCFRTDQSGAFCLTAD
ncbi:DNA internalization-related competence protein ComEC/Rec2 [Porcincola intestinalis]|uniref:DNA internalization-related competence protein ComEC/Rec2 n=1 Tax=Porcincola intestinalis TaxID=2606632 RepID=A0A6L5X771_9FIRM|nr:DNA internalization-related competence protein ComEC/Rec2 [Porcincola intestinalis]MDY5579117.1 DNA internalization-related competence protein ComEC/Rec2 [Porcincola intestinalis]MSS14232.1 DNA internalization-related competence protein ComEC/Rec2 [Porcincola intestinalis]